MSLPLQILAALKALAIAALPAADLVVIDAGEEEPAADRISPGGRIVIEYGDPGEPDVDLSPVMYNYSHAIPIRFAASKALNDTSALAAVAAMLTAFGAAIAADRQLGGLVEYLDAAAPPIDSLFIVGGTPAREANAVITAIYATPNPL